MKLTRRDPMASKTTIRWSVPKTISSQKDSNIMMRLDRRILSIAVAVVMLSSMFMPISSVAVSIPQASGRIQPRSIVDDAFDLIIPEGETYGLCGCHTYLGSIQINGTLNVIPYDGFNETTGSLTLMSSWIIIGPSGSIIADGRGYGGGKSPLMEKPGGY